MSYVTAEAIKMLRERRSLTQRELAEAIGVSDKAVSKWETGRGLPDVTLVEPLARTLGISVAELLSGECMTNGNVSANMMRTRFYVCPICGNVIHAIGEGAYSCCGVLLPALEAEPFDKAHELIAEKMDGEFYVSIDHPMTKDHFISFIAYLTSDRVQLRKLYPEQAAEARFTPCGLGVVYAFCNRHGLFSQRMSLR